MFLCINPALNVENESSILKWGRLHHNSTYNQRYDLRPTGPKGGGNLSQKSYFYKSVWVYTIYIQNYVYIQYIYSYTIYMQNVRRQSFNNRTVFEGEESEGNKKALESPKNAQKPHYTEPV